VQNALRQQLPAGPNWDAAPAVLAAGKHTQANHHRIAFSATSFPFKDPSPHSESPNLLGVRIDICVRGGKFVKPYYLLLKRVGENKKFLRVYRHTIPVFIPLSQLEERYLPPPQGDNDGGGDNLKPQKLKKQDLRRLVQELRRELVAYHLRCDSVAWLREQLRILEVGEAGGDNAVARTSDGSQQSPNQFGIVSVTATSLETRYIRLEWLDGRIGRIKLSNRGIVERAIVIGDDGRDKSMENVLTGGNGRIENLIQRLSDADTLSVV